MHRVIINQERGEIQEGLDSGSFIGRKDDAVFVLNPMLDKQFEDR
jgi:hypothetical protein